eukprot:scaffold118937_cov57-Phaeocystis_antarctica.AAC.3
MSAGLRPSDLCHPVAFFRSMTGRVPRSPPRAKLCRRSRLLPQCRAECQSERRAPSCTRAPAGAPRWRTTRRQSSACATPSTCRCSGASPHGTTKRSGSTRLEPHTMRGPSRRSTEHPTILARCRPRRWCQEDIKAWRKCFEEQRALDGRPVDSSDSRVKVPPWQRDDALGACASSGRAWLEMPRARGPALGA